jgi:hypothetical protein
MMKRGDYETLSAAIAESDVDDNARRALAFDLADALTSTGERFDPILWLRQCKIGDVKTHEVAEWSARLENRVESLARRRQHYETRVANGSSR